ncbi:MAG: transposase, partial [Pirellula sp.]
MSRRIRKRSYWQDAPLPREQIVLIPRSLDDSIPADHPVRIVDEILDAVDWTSWEKKYHGSMGQPPIHPSILCKIWIFALMRRIRSSRQVEYALMHSIDFMWLASGRRVDHGTLCKFRRANSKELKQLFRSLVSMAIDMGVANLSELCIDGTRVLANSNKNKVWTLESIQKVLEKLDVQVN